ncbi:(deoxy)nucleoside triphosphate pyrophosphohydrolase [Actomonas aquatica]|uniref:8-oxo-dGTP diphosphatase n=1 Tax=Actomonas aquatica TaxID=2866162 RepID=A0ABZ1CE43_9BACT|nr:(deoxy)nucleoside triphosphate pyrophosphohydrolase [Opitutus sp. WL0086]WRQ89953.1 (deoxy)nucleoside triphosphate pyrophosphohydrolase [Opitutus sp. WL0086]
MLLEHNDRVLIAQRPAGKHLAGWWEFPGGKLEAGEDAATALHRELDEELGCCIEVIAALPACPHRYETVSIVLHPLVARLTPDSPAPSPHEHAALDWLPVEQLDTVPLAAADLPVLAAYRTWLRQGRPST